MNMNYNTPLLFSISNNYRGEIAITTKALVKIANETLNIWKDKIKIRNVKVRVIDNFYLHLEIVLKLLNNNENIMPLIKNIKKNFNNIFLQQIDIKIYNIIIMFE